MMELTLPQMRAMEVSAKGPPRIVNPQTNETFVLLRVEEYERLKVDEYDDSDLSRQELEALNWTTGMRSGWADEEWEESDFVPGKP